MRYVIEMLDVGGVIRISWYYLGILRFFRTIWNGENESLKYILERINK
jgi:hypothetical protein